MFLQNLLVSLCSICYSLSLSVQDDDDEARLLEEQRHEEKLAQLQAQDQVIDTDLALIQEREERIRQLEVISPHPKCQAGLVVCISTVDT